MVQVNPFSVAPEEAGEIRQCARLLFKGANPAHQNETREAYQKWKYFFDVFVMSRDARYGNLLHLPFEGGVFEQPSKTMDAIMLIQSVYIEHLKEEQEKASKKIKAPRRLR
jgi:hypothetical protein